MVKEVEGRALKKQMKIKDALQLVTFPIKRGWVGGGVHFHCPDTILFHFLHFPLQCQP